MKTGKRVLSIILVTLMLLTAAPLAGFVGLEIAPKAKALAATGQCGDNVYWSFDEATGALTISGTGSTYDYSPYSNKNPFHESTDIITISISSGVTSIGQGLFPFCTELESISIPESVKSIGSQAFLGCSRLKSMTIPDSLTSIGAFAFEQCYGLEFFRVGSNNIKYSSDSFGCLYNKNKTELIRYPSGNKKTDYTVSGSVTNIYNSAFSGSHSLVSVAIPDSITVLADNTFNDCSALRSISLPNKLTNIGDSAFFECINLKNIEIPPSVTSIGDCAFKRCKSLESVTIPNGVSTIEAWTFAECSALATVEIPHGITKIAWDAFSQTALKSVVIPDSVEIIDSGAFSYCKELESVIIGYGVTTIGSGAFEGSAIINVTIGSNVTSIGYQAFHGCNSISNVYYCGTEEQWNQLSIEPLNESLTSATIHFSGAPEIPDDCFFPKNYNFNNDSYSFALKDAGVNISLKYFSRMFNPGPALLQYLMLHNGNEGMCFGFAYSTALLYNNLPGCSSFKNSDPIPLSHIRKLKLNSELYLGTTPSEELLRLESNKVGDTFTLLDLIIYSYIYQGTLESAITRLSNSNDLIGLYNTVKSYVDTNRVGVTISFTPKIIERIKHLAGHEVLAVGIRGNNIIVDEPNASNSPQELFIDGDSWHYGPSDQENCFNSNDYNISFKTDYNRVYNKLTDISILGSNGSSSNDWIDTDKFDPTDLLLLIEGNNFEIDRDDVFEVFPLNGENNERATRMLWVKDSSNIQINNVEKDSSISSAMGDTVISAKIGSEADINVIIEEGTANLQVNTQRGSETVLELSTVDKELNEYKVAITGIANGSQIQANKTETGITVSGLNNISIEYLENGNMLDTLSSNVTNGKEIHIMVDYDKILVSTDSESPHIHNYFSAVTTPATCTDTGIMTYTCSCGDTYTETIPALGHTDDDNDGHCDNCGEQMSGGDHCKFCGKIHNGGFFDKLTGFFHKIFAIFKR